MLIPDQGTVTSAADGVELRMDAANAQTHVRSASRIGHSDLGANGKRVEDLRGRFEAGGQ